MGFWTSAVRLRPVWPPYPATSLRASASGSAKAVELRRARAADLLLGSSPCVAETVPGRLRRRPLGIAGVLIGSPPQTGGDHAGQSAQPTSAFMRLPAQTQTVLAFD